MATAQRFHPVLPMLAPSNDHAFRGPTMSSREIADLTGKEHKNVLADAWKMLDELGATLADFSADLPDGDGRMQPALLLPKRETLILVSGCSVAMRARLVAGRNYLTYEDVAQLPSGAIKRYCKGWRNTTPFKPTNRRFGLSDARKMLHKLEIAAADFQSLPARTP